MMELIVWCDEGGDGLKDMERLCLYIVVLWGEKRGLDGLLCLWV